MKTLSPGKIRCMQQLTNEFGVFTVIALDHRDVFVAALSDTLGMHEADWATVAAEKTRIAKALSPHASAVLLDPLYSAGPVITRGVLSGDVAFAIAYEKAGYSGDDAGRVTTLLDGWSVGAIKRLGGSAVKLLLFYHPDAPTAAQQEALVQQVAAECDTHDIPLLLEPVCYSLEPGQPKTDPIFAAQRPNIVLESAQRLVPLGVDILKAEFPTDAAYEQNPQVMYDYCRQLSDITAGVPWVLLSAGVDFDTFQQQVEIASVAGASGFVAGRAVWKEALETPDVYARDRFLETIAVSRLRVLADVASYRATPWLERVTARVPDLEEGWYKRYFRE